MRADVQYDTRRMNPSKLQVKTTLTVFENTNGKQFWVFYKMIEILQQRFLSGNGEYRLISPEGVIAFSWKFYHTCILGQWSLRYILEVIQIRIHPDPDSGSGYGFQIQYRLFLAEVCGLWLQHVKLGAFHAWNLLPEDLRKWTALTVFKVQTLFDVSFIPLDYTFSALETIFRLMGCISVLPNSNSNPTTTGRTGDLD